MPASIDDQVIDFYVDLFAGIFSEPFRVQITDRLRRNRVVRQVEESADAASQPLIRFFVNQQVTEQQVANVLGGFDSLGDSLQLKDIDNPNVTPESLVETLLADLTCPEGVQQEGQDAIFRVALHSVVQVLMRIGSVMAEWQKLNFSSTFELPRRVTNGLNQISEQLDDFSRSGQSAADDRYELIYRDYLLQRFHRVEAGTVRMTTNLDVDLRELFVMPRVMPRSRTQTDDPELADADALMNLAAARQFMFDRGASAQEKEDKPSALEQTSALPVATLEVTRKTLPALARQSDVVAVLPNQKIRLIQPKEVDYTELGRQEIQDGLTWGLQQLEIPKLWEITKGQDINVAVLDTGVHGDHPALDGRVESFVVIDPLGRRMTANPTFDGGQHGTHVCGTIAGGKTADGVSIGVAPESKLHVAGVLIGDSTLLTLVEGISWAVEQGADIISMSLGFTYYEPLFAEVFDMLIEQFGILPVVAIGNENHGNSSSLGNAPNAFSIGAVEKMPRNKLEVASFSSGASLVFPEDASYPLVHKPDVVAPGVQVYSSIPPEKRSGGTFEYTYMDGSSMATPHVAGVAALLMAAKPEAQVSDIISALKDTAKHPAGEGKRPDNRWGYGMIQPVEALSVL